MIKRPGFSTAVQKKLLLGLHRRTAPLKARLKKAPFKWGDFIPQNTRLLNDPLGRYVQSFFSDSASSERDDIRGLVYNDQNPHALLHMIMREKDEYLAMEDVNFLSRLEDPFDRDQYLGVIAYEHKAWGARSVAVDGLGEAKRDEARHLLSDLFEFHSDDLGIRQSILYYLGVDDSEVAQAYFVSCLNLMTRDDQFKVLENLQSRAGFNGRPFVAMALYSRFSKVRLKALGRLAQSFGHNAQDLKYVCLNATDQNTATKACALIYKALIVDQAGVDELENYRDIFQEISRCTRFDEVAEKAGRHLATINARIVHLARLNQVAWIAGPLLNAVGLTAEA